MKLKSGDIMLLEDVVYKNESNKKQPCWENVYKNNENYIVKKMEIHCGNNTFLKNHFWNGKEMSKECDLQLVSKDASSALVVYTQLSIKEVKAHFDNTVKIFEYPYIDGRGFDIKIDNLNTWTYNHFDKKFICTRKNMQLSGYVHPDYIILTHLQDA